MVMFDILAGFTTLIQYKNKTDSSFKFDPPIDQSKLRNILRIKWLIDQRQRATPSVI